MVYYTVPYELRETLEPYGNYKDKENDEIEMNNLHLWDSATE